MLAALRRCGDTVFVPEEPATRRIRDLAVALTGTVTLAVLVAVRASKINILTTMWAEDGRIFLTDALRDGAGPTLLRGYNGYAHLGARIAAGITAALPAEWGAASLAVLSTLGVGALAVFSARAASSHITAAPARWVYALAIVLLPAAGIEVLGNIANLHWFLLVAAFWAVVWRPAATRHVALACGVVALAMLSDPLAVFLTPLVAWRVVTVTARRDRAVAVAFGLAAVVQGAVVLNTDSSGITPSFKAAIGLLEKRLLVGSVLGVDTTVDFVDAWGMGGVHIVAVLLVAAAGAAWWRWGGDSRALLLLGGVSAVGLFLVSVGLRGSGEDAGVISGIVAGGSRYTVAPALILAGLALVVLQRLDWRALVVPAVLALVVCAIDFRVPTLRNSDLTWARGLTIARTQCRFGLDPTQIPILPVTPDNNWRVDAPCSYLP